MAEERPAVVIASSCKKIRQAQRRFRPFVQRQCSGPRHRPCSGLIAPVRLQAGRRLKDASAPKGTLLHFVAVASDASASSGARASVQGRDWRGRTMEDAMKTWTINELMLLTREELCRLAEELEQGLTRLEPGTALRTTALTSLDNLRRVMTRRGLHF